MGRPDDKLKAPDGRLWGFVRETDNRELVCDWLGKMQGFCSDGGTFDSAGRRVAIGEQPGLLLKGKKDGDR